MKELPFEQTVRVIGRIGDGWGFPKKLWGTTKMVQYGRNTFTCPLQDSQRFLLKMKA